VPAPGGQRWQSGWEGFEPETGRHSTGGDGDSKIFKGAGSKKEPVAHPFAAGRALPRRRCIPSALEPESEVSMGTGTDGDASGEPLNAGNSANRFSQGRDDDRSRPEASYLEGDLWLVLAYEGFSLHDLMFDRHVSSGSEGGDGEEADDSGNDDANGGED